MGPAGGAQGRWVSKVGLSQVKDCQGSLIRDNCAARTGIFPWLPNNLSRKVDDKGNRNTHDGLLGDVSSHGGVDILTGGLLPSRPTPKLRPPSPLGLKQDWAMSWSGCHPHSRVCSVPFHSHRAVGTRFRRFLPFFWVHFFSPEQRERREGATRHFREEGERLRRGEGSVSRQCFLCGDGTVACGNSGWCWVSACPGQSRRLRRQQPRCRAGSVFPDVRRQQAAPNHLSFHRLFGNDVPFLKISGVFIIYSFLPCLFSE